MSSWSIQSLIIFSYVNNVSTVSTVSTRNVKVSRSCSTHVVYWAVCNFSSVSHDKCLQSKSLHNKHDQYSWKLPFPVTSFNLCMYNICNFCTTDISPLDIDVPEELLALSDDQKSTLCRTISRDIVLRSWYVFTFSVVWFLSHLGCYSGAEEYSFHFVISLLLVYVTAQTLIRLKEHSLHKKWHKFL